MNHGRDLNAICHLVDHDEVWVSHDLPRARHAASLVQIGVLDDRGEGHFEAGAQPLGGLGIAFSDVGVSSSRSAMALSCQWIGKLTKPRRSDVAPRRR